VTDDAASLVVVLHAHLPWVRHPEHDDHLEERWFFEALVECYLPLCETFERLADRGVPFRATLSLSPTLLALFDDPLIRERAARHLRRTVRLARRETERFGDGPPWGPLARWYLERFSALAARVGEPGGRDVPGVLRDLEAAGHLELITTAASHALLPLLDGDRAFTDAQVGVGLAEHERRFRRPPAGFWLPECAWTPALDEVLAAHGLAFTFLETHALLHGQPAALGGGWLPVMSPAGVACFGRDPESSRQIWSATEGYPGDPLYREFHRDIGHEREYGYIRPFLPAGGVRADTGLKYRRVTGREEDKEPWDPEAALARAGEHAAHYAGLRRAKAAELSPELGRPAVFTAPLDAELLGHWWFEGPAFLEALFEDLARTPEALVARTPSEVLATGGPWQEVLPAVSSWGEGGYFGVWLDEDNDWLPRPLAEVRRRLSEEVLPRVAGGGEPLLVRAARQAAREALLAHASDWPFILRTGTAVGYATARAETHLRRALALCDMVREGQVDGAYLEEVEAADPIFPELDLAAFEAR